MPDYIILTVNAAGPGACSKRMEHLLGANVAVEPGAPAPWLTTVQLLDEQARGANFIIFNGTSVFEQPSAKVVSCPCGGGYLLLKGTSDLERTEQARGD